MRYLTVLGQNPELSLAELEAVYPVIKILSREGGAAVLESAEEIDIGRLGGTPKIGAFLGEAENLEKTKHIIMEELLKLGEEKKIFFGLSFYNNFDRKKYDRLGKEIKTALKNTGRKARWANSRELALSSVYIKTNKLLTRGFDFDLLFSPPLEKEDKFPSPPLGKGGQGGISIFKTIAVQDFSDYEFRDIGRPARDLRSGMTPPKLAKILINLSRKIHPRPPFQKEGAHIDSPLRRRGGGGDLKNNFLDPFCGSGTFLMEAALLGFKNICGSDISEKAVMDSKKNIEWLKEKYKLLETETPTVKLCDIKNIAECWPASRTDGTKPPLRSGSVAPETSAGRPQKFSAIATEPYLGPPIRGALSSAQAQKLQKELSELYGAYLKNLSEVLESGGRLILIVPFFITREKNPPPKSPPTPLLQRGAKSFSKGGSPSLYKREDKRDFHLSLKIKEAGLSAVRPSILYSRPDQKVGREIYILKKI